MPEDDHQIMMKEWLKYEEFTVFQAAQGFQGGKSQGVLKYDV